MSRVDSMISVVLRQVQDEGARNVSPQEILEVLNRTERDVCRRGLALRADATLTTGPGKDTYPVASNLYRLANIQEPTAWTSRVECLHDLNRFIEVSRETNESTQPLYAIIWNKVLRLFPAPSDAQKLILYAFALPDEDMVAGGDPQVDYAWDEILEIGAIHRLLLGRPNYNGNLGLTYVSMINAQRNEEWKEGFHGVKRVAHSSDDIGF